MRILFIDKPPRLEPKVDLLACGGMNGYWRYRTPLSVTRNHHQQVVNASYSDKTSCHGINVSLTRIPHNLLYLGKIKSSQPCPIFHVIRLYYLNMGFRHWRRSSCYTAQTVPCFPNLSFSLWPLQSRECLSLRIKVTTQP